MKLRRPASIAAWFVAGSLYAATADLSWVERAGGVAVTDASGKVVSVDLRAGWITDHDIPLLTAMPGLKRLDLSLTQVSDRGLRELKNARSIEDLNLYFAERVSDEGTAAFKGWKALKKLNLRGTKISDSTLEFLTTVPTLQWLDIGFAEVTDVGLDHLSSCANLRWLSIGGNKLTDSGLQFLRQLPQLEYLDVGGAQRTDSGMWSLTLTNNGVQAIASVGGLRELRLAGTAISTPGLDILKSSLTKLEHLNLQGCKRLRDDAVPVLTGFKSLKSLDLKDSGLTKEAVDKLKQSMPDCQILY